ncbi:glycosyltransferase [Clostridium sp.]|uniref:glycosyltransferase n=1 Tax=Clostridium sp. TaxID=1506 RepID=UPI00261DC65C|nr:glycosyltransferase [uncultured Clostridium sp.]
MEVLVLSTKKKLKVLHIVEAMGGGVFSYIVGLTNNMCDEFEVTIAYALRSQTPKDFDTYFDKRIKLIKVKNFTRNISLKNDAKAFFEIKKIYKEIQPDVVHLHSSKAGILGRFAINGKKVKMFYTPHGYAFLKEDDSVLKRNVYKFFEWTAAKRMCTTIACSKGEYEPTLRLTKNATYINNGININEFDGVKRYGSSQNEGLKICTVGRICFQKNPELFNKIAEAFPNISFTWIGGGEMKDKLTNSNIEITGWVDKKTALEIMSRSNIFLLPSLWEGLPISLLEAMYLKKICIVSNVIGNKDVIRHGENGFVANKLNEYVEIINKLQQEKYDIDRIQKNCFEDVLNEYNMSNMAKRYEQVYKTKIIM